MRHGWTNLKKIETDCGFLKLENLRWTFCILGQRFCPNVQADHSYKSEDTYQYNLVSKDIKWEKALHVDVSCQNRLCLSSLFY